MNNFAIVLQAIFQKAGIQKSLKEVQDIVNKQPVQLMTKLETATTKNEIKQISKELADAFNKQYNLNVTAKDVEKTFDALSKAQKKAQEEINTTVSKIKELQQTNSIKLDFDTAKNKFDELNKLNVLTDELKNDFIQLQTLYNSIGTSKTPKDLISNYEKFDLTLNKVNNSMRDIAVSQQYALSKAQKKAQEYVDSFKVIKLSNKIESWLTNNTAATKEAKEELKKYISILKNTDVNNSQFNQISSRFDTINTQMRKAGKLGDSLNNTIKKGAKSFMEWTITSQSIMMVVDALRDAVNEIKEIDSIITEISKANDDLTNEQLEFIADNSYDVASKYGESATGYLSAMQEVTRAGYENAEGMAKLSVLAQSAGDMTDELANQYLIASDAAYGYSGDVKKLNALLDAQNQITNRNAVNMTELAEATKIVASQAHQSGVAENELTAVLATMIATTQQGGEIAARAFKGILMNLQQVSGEIDGEVIDEESFAKVEKRLNSVGVAMETVVDGTAKLRDPIEILADLAEVYNSLPDDSVDKAGIIADLGGKYRGGQLASFLSNIDTYYKILKDYENATGSAYNEAMKSSNDLQGSITRLGNTWNDTVQNVLNADDLTNFVNGLNDLLQLLNKLTEKTGTLGTIGLGIGSFLGIKNAGRGKTYPFTILYCLQ